MSLPTEDDIAASSKEDPREDYPLLARDKTVTLTSPSSGFKSVWHRVTRVKTLKTIMAEHQSEYETPGQGLRRELHISDVIAYGLGSTLGAGIFVVAGQAATGSDSRLAAGPSVSLSFAISAIACLLSAFCYAEFSSRIPVSGSAYSFAYASLGEGLAWFIGWNLTLEYGVSAAAVARAWQDYVKQVFELMGRPLPEWIYHIPLSTPAWLSSMNSTFQFANQTNGIKNVPSDDGSNINLCLLAPLIIFICSCVILLGAKISARFNASMMMLNLLLVSFIIIAGATQVEFTNWQPFAPSGARGVLENAGFVFFSFIGFDCVCTLAEELRNPQRDLPRGIVITLAIVTFLYISVSLVLTGMQKYTEISAEAPLAGAFAAAAYPRVSFLIAIGTTTTLASTTLCSLYGQPRIFFRMAKDGLIPERFSKLDAQGVPRFGVLVTGLGAGILASLLDLGRLTEMISIGTLLAFSSICLGILVLRYLSPEPRNFSVHMSADHTQNGSSLRICVFLLAQFCANLTITSGSWHGSLLQWSTFGVATFTTILSIVALASIQQNKNQAKFKVPFVPWLPCAGIAVNTHLILGLPSSAILRLGVWTFIGSGIYFGYGIQNSRLHA